MHLKIVFNICKNICTKYANIAFRKLEYSKRMNLTFSLYCLKEIMNIISNNHAANKKRRKILDNFITKYAQSYVIKNTYSSWA